MFDTSAEAAFLTLIFIKFACSVKKVSVCRTSAYHRKKAPGVINGVHLNVLLFSAY